MKSFKIFALMLVLASLSAAQSTPVNGSRSLPFSNDTTTGTLQYKLAKLTGSASAVVLAISDTQGAVGVCDTNCGTSGVSYVAFEGIQNCAFDGSTTANDTVTISTTLAGACHDSGNQTAPANQCIGRVLSTNGAAGNFQIVFGCAVPTGAGGGSLGFTPENLANKGAANGYAGLDGAGKVPSAQLPATSGAGLGDPGGNGLVMRTAANITVPAVAGTDYMAPLGFTPAADSAVVHNTGNETIAGNKTFSGTVAVGTTLHGIGGFNLVGAGDSRMSAAVFQAPLDLLTQISYQPQFAGLYATMHNGAVGGAKCSDMTAVYAANVQPYKPSGSVTTSYLFILDGHNDYVGGVTLSSLENCYKSYVAQAVSDGFTPILITSYYAANLTAAQDSERQQFNDWLRIQPYLVIDADLFFPPLSSNPWYGTQAWQSAITGYSITGGIATITPSSGLVAGQVVYLTGFPVTSQCLNGSYVTVSSATGSNFQGALACPNAASSDSGYGAVFIADTIHLNAAGIGLLAKEINNMWGIAKSGTTLAHPQGQDYFNPSSGHTAFVGDTWATGCIRAGTAGVAACMGAGYIYSDAGAQSGAVFLGSNHDSYIYRVGTSVGYNWQLGAEGGGVSLVGLKNYFKANGFVGAGVASFAPGGQAGSSPGTPVCATSHVCDSFSGTINFTTGTTPAAGQFMVIGTTPRTTLPNCIAKVRLAASPYTELPALLQYATPADGQLIIYVGAAPAASTAYEIVYAGCGGN